MKKKLAAVLLFCFVLFALAGCVNFNTQLENVVSEIHERVLHGRSDAFDVTVTVGKIEEDFVLDGIKTGLKDFTSFRVQAVGNADGYKELGISYRYNDQSVEHDLEKNPKYGVWTLILNSAINTDALDVVIFTDKDNFIVPTEKVDMGNFSPLDKLKEKFKDELMTTHDGKKFNCEISMRFVKSHGGQGTDDECKFFWFVVVHTPKRDSFGIMVDAETGKVISQKK